MNLTAEFLHPVEVKRTVGSRKVQMSLDIQHLYAIINGLDTCQCNDCPQMVKILMNALMNPDY